MRASSPAFRWFCTGWSAKDYPAYRATRGAVLRDRLVQYRHLTLRTAGLVTSFNLVQTISGTVSTTVGEDVVSTIPDSKFRWDPSASHRSKRRPARQGRLSGSVASAASKEINMTLGRDKGIVDLPSNHSVDQTVEKLKGILAAKDVTLFALVDHSGEAEKAGMKMRPTKLLIFGSPKAGTPLMLAAPSVAIDLPLKILIWEDSGGKVWVSYNSPAYLQGRHGLPNELLQNIAVVETLAVKAGE